MLSPTGGGGGSGGRAAAVQEQVCAQGEGRPLAQFHGGDCTRHGQERPEQEDEDCAGADPEQKARGAAGPGEDGQQPCNRRRGQPARRGRSRRGASSARAAADRRRWRGGPPPRQPRGSRGAARVLQEAQLRSHPRPSRPDPPPASAARRAAIACPTRARQGAPAAGRPAARARRADRSRRRGPRDGEESAQTKTGRARSARRTRTRTTASGPCSSHARRASWRRRASPPHLESQRSNPPREDPTRSARSADSIRSSRAAGSSHRSLHTVRRRGRGRRKPRNLEKRKGVRPARIRPIRRACGWIQKSHAVEQGSRRSCSHVLRGAAVRGVQRPVQHWAAVRALAAAKAPWRPASDARAARVR